MTVTDVTAILYRPLIVRGLNGISPEVNTARNNTMGTF